MDLDSVYCKQLLDHLAKGVTLPIDSDASFTGTTPPPPAFNLLALPPEKCRHC